MALPIYLALVSDIQEVDLAETAEVAAALQKQVTRDFGPTWGVEAVVSAFASLEDVPLGYWPIVLQADIGYDGAAGIHLDSDHQPFALIEYSQSWSLTASHETCEILADPYGNRLVVGDSINPKRPGRVEYLVEVSDPSEDAKFGYSINGVLVSDFYTPRYFDPVESAGVQYSFTGSIKKPRQVLRGGYLSWHDPVNDHWYQAQWFSGNKVKIADLGKVSLKKGQSLRAALDRITYRQPTGGRRKATPLTKAVAPRKAAVARKSVRTGMLMASAGPRSRSGAGAVGSKAAMWRNQITAIAQAGPTSGGDVEV